MATGNDNVDQDDSDQTASRKDIFNRLYWAKPNGFTLWKYLG